MKSWNDNIKKILDFIPAFEKMSAEIQAEKTKEKAISRAEFDDLRDEIKSLSKRLGDFKVPDNSAEISSIIDRVDQLSIDFERKIDSTRRAYSELNDNALADFNASIEQLSKSNQEIELKIKAVSDDVKVLQKSAYDDKWIRNELIEISKANSSLIENHDKLEQEISGFKSIFEG